MTREFPKIVYHVASVALAAGLVLLTSCSVGPKYTRPSAMVPPAYKELGAPKCRRYLESSATT